MTIRILITTILLITLFNCHNSKKDHTLNLDGEYFFSEGSNLSYYIPKKFKGAYVTNDEEFDSLIKTISHPKLKESINHFYRNAYVHPEAFNAQYFYMEDANHYAFLIINELKHIRLNDLEMNYFKDYRNSSLQGYTKDSSATITFTDDKFINNSDYQLMISRGKTTTSNDSVFWEFYIESKFLNTFTIVTKSNRALDFQPYIKAIAYGDKRN
ncbi:hypothetical protein [Winogradskyella vidalii]|uniref:hypothetical protein n=1 Tax=Winogradskyella vidalii TaxID=2615024 RepID=UPI0015C6ACEC|nr:hypothetical protein [Winogradskyella vidalii]